MPRDDLLFRAMSARLLRMPETSYAAVLGRNLRVARAAADLSQDDVSQRMNALGFDAWQPSTVSLVERAKRRLMCEEALGLMVALETDLTAILFPPVDFQTIVLPGGQWTTLPAARPHEPQQVSAWDGNKCLLDRHPGGKAGNGAA